MANLLRVSTSNGPILIEVNHSDSTMRQVDAAEDRIKDAAQALKEGLDQIVAFSDEFAGSIKKLGNKAKKAEIEIGLELTGEGKFFFASAKSTATFTAKIEFDLTE